MFQKVIPFTQTNLLSKKELKYFNKMQEDKFKTDKNGNVMLIHKSQLKNTNCCICQIDQNRTYWMNYNFIEASIIAEDPTKLICHGCYKCGFKFIENNEFKFKFQNIAMTKNEFEILITHTKYYEPVHLMAPKIIEYMSLMNHFHKPLFEKMPDDIHGNKNIWFFKISDDFPAFILSSYRKKEHFILFMIKLMINI